MGMKSYVVLEKFTLSLINNPGLNMGLTVIPGEIIQYDGYNVIYGKIEDASVTLKKCIDLGWLRELAGKAVDEIAPAPKVESLEKKNIEEAYEVAREVKHPSTTNGNNAQQIYSSATFAERGLSVYTEDGEGVIARATMYEDAGSTQQHATAAQTGRTKIAVLDEGDQNVIVAPVRHDRGIVTPSTASSANHSRIVSSGIQGYQGDTNVIQEQEEQEVIPLKYKIPSQIGKTEVTSRTPSSDEAIERGILKKAGLQYSEHVSKSSTLLVEGDQGIVSGDPQQQAKQREEARREWELAKLEAIGRRRKNREVPPAPETLEKAPSVEEEEELTVGGYTYKDMKGAGWSDEQLLASEYAMLVPVSNKTKKTPPPTCGGGVP